MRSRRVGDNRKPKVGWRLPDVRNNVARTVNQDTGEEEVHNALQVNLVLHPLVELQLMVRRLEKGSTGRRSRIRRGDWKNKIVEINPVRPNV